MKSASNLISNAQNSALYQNEQTQNTWTLYRNDVRTTQNLLESLPKALSQNVMVPLGPKAMMRGKIFHTNEFLVSLGDGYLVKRTAGQAHEFCNRKIASVNEVLENLEKERALLLNALSIPTENEAFGSDERPEIVEHVTEEEDKQWRVEHRQREKHYYKQLSEIRKNKTKIESEEDLWRRLEELELEEELEDELNRIHQGDDDEDEEEEEEEIVNSTAEAEEIINSTEEAEEEIINGQEEADERNKEVVNTSKEDTDNTPLEPAVVPRRKRSVVFANEELEEITDSVDEPLRLNFKHSDIRPIASKYEESHCIEMPSDIYPSYQYQCKMQQLQPILRVRTNPNQKKEMEIARNLDNKLEEEEKKNSTSGPPIIAAGITIPSVVERNVGLYQQQISLENLEPDGPPRRISKFKVNRLKQKSGV